MTAILAGSLLGVNFADTFRVENGLLTVAYSGYENFDARFGHLFYAESFSHFRLRLEYRFVGKQVNGGPDWARRNSAVMLHAQAPDTMPVDQDFPVSIEFQFLGGLGADRLVLPSPAGRAGEPQRVHGARFREFPFVFRRTGRRSLELALQQQSRHGCAEKGCQRSG